MTHHLRIFEKALYLVLLRLMDYRERQRSQFVQASGLQKLTQKFGPCLYLEMVAVRSRFRLNCIKTYVNCVHAHSFINCVLSMGLYQCHNDGGCSHFVRVGVHLIWGWSFRGRNFFLLWCIFPWGYSILYGG